MVNDWTRRSWLLLSPLQAGLTIVLWIVPCHAALLKDIRIGEYEKFTRIVFEFNVQTDMDSIGKVLPNQLKITFPDVRTEFTRPIPQKHSERLNEYKVWQHKNRLSVIFRFNSDNLSFDSFQLKSPPRLVVDVYDSPGTTKVPGKTKNQIAQELVTNAGSSTPRATDSKIKPSPMPLDSLAKQHNANSSAPADFDSMTLKKQPAAPQPIPADRTSIKQPVAVQHSDSSGMDELNTVTTANVTQPKVQKGLQHYLLIALVILTIVILSLMVVMLFSRHKWTNSKKTIKLDDLLDRQDQHIASINSQIEEHLKRYDEI
jgi:hypothetical protein